MQYIGMHSETMGANRVESVLCLSLLIEESVDLEILGFDSYLLVESI